VQGRQRSSSGHYESNSVRNKSILTIKSLNDERNKSQCKILIIIRKDKQTSKL
jgi:hypothetical protein